MNMETNKILTTFGETLRSLRSEKGISQEKLAELTGLHRTYISDIERGERNVSLVNIIRIADGLEIQISSLFNLLELKMSEK